ncbi:LPD7 domain-containing protein [Azohydromonas australica]|uniref:LPD7 domain-containing protein n=1 Tax=Azohydromonas australica TaxID=364039 RepID=UPI00042586F3|nr:LPD7 domain-containing protein [Azohydromonas australica]
MADDRLPANRYELRLQGGDAKIFTSAEKVAAAFHAADVDKMSSVHRFLRGQPETEVARTAVRTAPQYVSESLERFAKHKAVDPVPPEGERFRDAYYAAVDASLRMRLESVEDWNKVQPTKADGVWKLDRATYDDLEALAFARPERAMQAWMDHVGSRYDAPTLVDFESGQVVTLADTVNLRAARNLHEYRFEIDLNAQQASQQSQPPALAQAASEKAPSQDDGQRVALLSSEPASTVRVEQTPGGAPRVQVGPNQHHWLNENAQWHRDVADRRGLTAGIEAEFAQGKTAEQVIRAMGKELEFLPVDDRPNFIVGVRATLGIPSQATSDGQQEFQAWKAEYDKRQASQSATPIQPQQEGPVMNLTRLQIDGVDVGRLAFEKHSTEAGVFVDLAALDRSDKPVAQFTGVNKDELNNLLGPTVGHEVAKFNGRTGEFKGEQLDVPAAEVAQAAKVVPAKQAQQPAAAAAKVKQAPIATTATAAKQEPAAKTRRAKAVKAEQQPAVPAATERPTPANSVEPANGLAYAIDGSAVESVKFNRRGKGQDQVVDLQGFNGKQQVIEAKAVPVAELARVVGEAAAQHITSVKGHSGTLRGEVAPSPVEPSVLAATAAARSGGKAAAKQAQALAPAAAPLPRPAAPAGGGAPTADPTDTVTVEVLRRGQRETISLQTGSSRELGLTMRPLQGDEARAAGVAGGLLVGGVSGAANRAGVLPGDVLVAVNGTPVSSIDQVRAAAAKPAPAPSSTPAQQASAPSSVPAQQPAAVTSAPAIEEPAAVKARREAERLAIEALKASLAERFIVRAGHAADSTEYRFRGEPGVLAFVDRGSKLATDRNEADVARGIVDLAQAKGWKALALAGTEDFRRNVWREAAARGLPASGYTPTKADQEWVAARQGAHQANTVARTDAQQPAQQPAQRPAQAVASTAGDTPRQGATKEQVMNAMRAGLRDLNMDKASSDRIMERLSVRLDGLLAQGKPLPNIARYDRAAMSKMPEFAARQAQQQGQARARAR